MDELLEQLIDGGRGGVASGVASGVAEAQIEKRFYEVLHTTKTPASRSEILEKLNLSLSNTNSDKYIKPLIEIGWIEMTMPDKPTSPNQQYRTTLKGQLLLALTEN